MKIPKKLHYVWLGEGEKPKIFYKCLESWKKYCPNYEIVEINESNFDLNYHLNKNKFFRECYERKLWAYVSDYARINFLYENGGIYLDTDMEIVKGLDTLLNKENIDFLSSFETKSLVGMSLFIAKPKSKVLEEVLKVYEKDIWEHEIFTMPSIINYVLKNKFNFSLLEKEEIKDDIYIYDTSYFYPIPFIKEKDREYPILETTYGIHWWNHSWKGEKSFIFLATKHLKGFKKYRELVRRYKKWIINDIILKKGKK